MFLLTSQMHLIQLSVKPPLAVNKNTNHNVENMNRTALLISLGRVGHARPGCEKLCRRQRLFINTLKMDLSRHLSSSIMILKHGSYRRRYKVRWWWLWERRIVNVMTIHTRKKNLDKNDLSLRTWFGSRYLSETSAANLGVSITTNLYCAMSYVVTGPIIVNTT